MNQTRKEIDSEMDKIQSGLDFSFAIAQIMGKTLTSKQQRTKERTLINLILSESPEHEDHLQDLIEFTEANRESLTISN